MGTPLNGSSMMARTQENIATFAPMPRPSERSTASVTHGVLASIRAAYRASWEHRPSLSRAAGRTKRALILYSGRICPLAPRRPSSRGQYPSARRWLQPWLRRPGLEKSRFALVKLTPDELRTRENAIFDDCYRGGCSLSAQFVTPNVRNTGHARIRSISPVFAKSARPRPGSPADCGTSL